MTVAASFILLCSTPRTRPSKLLTKLMLSLHMSYSPSNDTLSADDAGVILLDIDWSDFSLGLISGAETEPVNCDITHQGKIHDHVLS